MPTDHAAEILLETRPAEAKGIHQSVVDTIVRRILTNEYPQGEIIPGLETLAEELGTSRTTVREAMRVLSAKGFVDSRRRAGTRVNRRSEWNLLDRDVLGWLLDGTIARDIGESLLVLRRIIEPEAAALAAKAASARQLAAIEDAYHRMRDNLPDDIDACCSADVDFHTALLGASGNIFLEQLAHTIRTALLVTFERSTRLAESHVEALSLHEAIVEHVRRRDAAAARQTMTELLHKTEKDLQIGSSG
ncbi:MAG: FadR/GntR family transcriptional regulator [Pararhizobium sp.]